MTRDTRSALCLALGILAAYVAMHPYRGIIADALIYVTREWSAQGHETLGRDLLFASQSQTSLSAFGPLLRGVLQILPVDQAAQAMACLGLLLWCAGAGLLVWTLAQRASLTACAMAALLALAPLTYAPSASFHAGEFFAVPRPFAEGFALGALAALLAGRRMLALFALLACALFHPLVGLTCAVVIFAYCALEDCRWLVAGAAGAGLLVLAAVFDAPFAGRLFQRLDGDWRALLEARTSYLFLTRAGEAFWADLGLRATILLIAGLSCEGAPRRMFLALLLACAGCIGVSLILGDILSSLLVVQAQPWRVLWIAAVLTPPAMVMIALRQRDNGDTGRLMLACLACAFAWREAGLLSLPFCGGALFLHARRAEMKRIDPRMAIALWTLAGAGWLIFTALPLAMLARALLGAPAGLDFEWVYLWGLQPLALPVGALVIVWVQRGALPAPRKAALYACAACVFAFARWDDRGAFERALERNAPPVELVAAIPPGDAPVLWLGGGKESWYWLGRPNWAAGIQASSLVFSQPLADIWGARAGFLVEHRFEPPGLVAYGGAAHGWQRNLEPENIARLCARQDAPAAIVAPLDENAPEPTGARIIAAPVASFALQPQAHGLNWVKRTRYAIFACGQAHI